MVRAIRWLSQFLGSLGMAVGLLLTIAAVLAWGTFYEVRFGTAAVQRFVYASWWFQALLAFLALNLAVAALQRYPWRRRHVPFVLAHVGIIAILTGGVLGGRFAIEGQLVIPEGATRQVLQLPQKTLAVFEPNPGAVQLLPTRFEATAWARDPQVRWRVPLEAGPLDLVVDGYLPDAQPQERVLPDAEQPNPAIHIRLSHEGQEADSWLFARDPQRFGLTWGEAHVLLLEPQTPTERLAVLGAEAGAWPPHGVLLVTLASDGITREIPVPRSTGAAVPVPDSPYVVTFKELFADLAVTASGVRNRSAQPHNPAVALTLSGPEGTDAHLLLARQPDLEALPGVTRRIPATLRYLHPAATRLPPNAFVFVADGAGARVVVTDGASARLGVSEAAPGAVLEHPALGYRLEILAVYPRARITAEMVARTEQVRQEAVHVTLMSDGGPVPVWLLLEAPVEVRVQGRPVRLEYRPLERELPFAVTLLDFRKIDYPGTEMAAGFESDVELTDPARGTMLIRTIKMNDPLRYRGFSLYQSSYIPGPVETTVLSVRSDPGTPLVYAGFLVVILGVISMFVMRRNGVSA